MKDKVWDLPLRLFHWTLVLLLGLSWWTAETNRDDLHFWSGYGIVFLLLFRLLWGLFGSSTARFASFVRGPGALATYLKSGLRWTAAGHTPLGALSVIALLLTLLVQVSTGLIATDDDGLVEGPLASLVSFATADLARDIHHVSFDILKWLAALHVAAILFYFVARKLDLVTPMIGGKADLAPGVPPMRPVPAAVPLACAAIALAVTAWIAAGAPPFAT